MNQPIVRVIGFVVLLTIVLSTGFTAIGATLPAPGGLLMAERYGGKYSPGGAQPGEAPPPAPFRNRRVSRISVRARLMYIAPVPLLIAGLNAIGRGNATETLGELGAYAGLTLSAWLLTEGLRAEEAYDARAVARPPAIPRKLFAAVLAGASIVLAGVASLGTPLPSAIAFGVVAGVAHLLAFGIDPMRKKGLEGVDASATDRVARAIDQAEALVTQVNDAARRIGDRRIEGRVERLCGQAREVFRVVERDPRDLGRARTFLTVYLLGLRDATVKFADVWTRSQDGAARQAYEDLLGDLEQSFAAQRAHLLEDDRSSLDIEIEVLRDRLKQDGLVAR